MLASAKLIREVKFTYSVVVAKGKGHGNFFSRLDEQFTLAPTPWDSGKNCFSHVHSFGQGVMIWLVHNEPKTRITNATIRELIIIEELLSLWFLSQAALKPKFITRCFVFDGCAQSSAGDRILCTAGLQDNQQRFLWQVSWPMCFSLFSTSWVQIFDPCLKGLYFTNDNFWQDEGIPWKKADKSSKFGADLFCLKCPWNVSWPVLNTAYNLKLHARNKVSMYLHDCATPDT